MKFKRDKRFENDSWDIQFIWTEQR